MSTALQRLLARPSSLAFLRYLSKESALEHALERVSKEPCVYVRHVRHQRCSNSATKTPWEDLSSLKAVVDDANNDKPHLLKSAYDYPQYESVTPPQSLNDHHMPQILDADGSPTPWGTYLHTYNDVEFQSDVGLESDDRKLVNHPAFSKDLTLWAYLLDFRRRNHGDAGVAIFWTAIRKRGLLLPTEGSMADKLWPIFLQAGFQDNHMLQDVCQYADELFNNASRRWSKFYAHIMQHIILKGEHDTIVPWHERLIERHPPDPAIFSSFARNVTLMGGDLDGLKLLYKTKFYKANDSYKTYGDIIPILVEQKDFHTAMQWHLFLVRRGDHPLNSKVVESLINYYEIYDPWKARRIKSSLFAVGLPFSASVRDNMEESEMISREMMNIVHGKTFGIEPKQYNDRLGARWFATTWISLDLAINIIHALGIQGIGPLSLQAIALREVDASAIVRRIDQLKEVGISIGGFVFSKALESFARNGEIEFLNDLLQSDQHPDSYENRQLQDDLLAAYARAGDWAQYRLTATIQVLGSHNSRVSRYNIMQRANISRGDRPAFFKMLEEMRVQRIPFHEKTVTSTRQFFLPLRRKGRGPNPRRKYLMDLQKLISVLRTIMEFGSYVPPPAWREIIRRLGMRGRFNDLEKLCFWLTAYYHRKIALRSQPVEALSPVPASEATHPAPKQIPNTYRYHPLRLLFSNSLQRAIVEWAFKQAPIRQPSQSTIILNKSAAGGNRLQYNAYRYARGVKLLRQLRDQGVFISMRHVRRALRVRFAILYDPGESRVVRNRLLKKANPHKKEDMVAHLNEVWGEDIWKYK